MTTDLTCLALNALWGFVLVYLEIFGKTRAAGAAWNAGNRDVAPEVPAWVARAGRALGNHKENFAFFATAVVVLHLAHRNDGATATAAVVYAVARVAYSLVYLAGIPVVRSAIFTVGALALLVLYVKILTG
jgi:uncharacterized MAPEG superfamily protein